MTESDPVASEVTHAPSDEPGAMSRLRSRWKTSETTSSQTLIPWAFAAVPICPATVEEIAPARLILGEPLRELRRRGLDAEEGAVERRDVRRGLAPSRRPLGGVHRRVGDPREDGRGHRALPTPLVRLRVGLEVRLEVRHLDAGAGQVRILVDLAGERVPPEHDSVALVDGRRAEAAPAGERLGAAADVLGVGGGAGSEEGEGEEEGGEPQEESARSRERHWPGRGAQRMPPGGTRVGTSNPATSKPAPRRRADPQELGSGGLRQRGTGGERAIERTTADAIRRWSPQATG